LALAIDADIAGIARRAHAPQFCASVVTSEHVPLHSFKFAAQAHVEPLHTSSAAHA